MFSRLSADRHAVCQRDSSVDSTNFRGAEVYSEWPLPSPRRQASGQPGVAHTEDVHIWQGTGRTGGRQALGPAHIQETQEPSSAYSLYREKGSSAGSRPNCRPCHVKSNVQFDLRSISEFGDIAQYMDSIERQLRRERAAWLAGPARHGAEEIWDAALQAVVVSTSGCRRVERQTDADKQKDILSKLKYSPSSSRRQVAACHQQKYQRSRSTDTQSASFPRTSSSLLHAREGQASLSAVETRSEAVDASSLWSQPGDVAVPDNKEEAVQERTEAAWLPHWSIGSPPVLPTVHQNSSCETEDRDFDSRRFSPIPWSPYVSGSILARLSAGLDELIDEWEEDEPVKDEPVKYETYDAGANIPLNTSSGRVCGSTFRVPLRASKEVASTLASTIHKVPTPCSDQRRPAPFSDTSTVTARAGGSEIGGRGRTKDMRQAAEPLHKGQEVRRMQLLLQQQQRLRERVEELVAAKGYTLSASPRRERPQTETERSASGPDRMGVKTAPRQVASVSGGWACGTNYGTRTS